MIAIFKNNKVVDNFSDIFGVILLAKILENEKIKDGKLSPTHPQIQGFFFEQQKEVFSCFFSEIFDKSGRLLHIRPFESRATCVANSERPWQFRSERALRQRTY